MLRRLPVCSRHEQLNIVRILDYYNEKRAVEPLLELLDSHVTEWLDMRFQELAIDLLGKLGDARALEPLRQMRKDAPDKLQYSISRAIAQLDATASFV